MLLGASMLGWAAASFLMERMFNGPAPTLPDLMGYAVLVLLGGIYLGLGALTRQRIRWALWTAYILSTVLFLTAVAFALVLQTRYGNTYLILLSFATACACGLALRTQYPERSAPLLQPVESGKPSPSARGLIGPSSSLRASPGRAADASSPAPR
jgi:hypothetical protein